jgi:hypothetical protein
VTVGAGSELVIEMSDLEIESWQAVLATAPDVGARALADGEAGPIVFAAPDAGRWSLRVRIHFADGDATYYWALSAE